MTTEQVRELAQLALRIREHIIRMATDGGCFIGASLSCADLLAFLYKRVLRLSSENLRDRDRDYMLLSKGHDVPALYATLAELGFIDRNRLANHLKTTDFIYWHPNRAVPGVEFHSGSLGHLLSVSIGIALDIKMRRTLNRVFVLTGDGELDEGSMWEAALVAAAKRLDNLVAIVDRNEFQANFRTEDLIPLEPIEKKFEAFGWSTRRIDGHSFEQMEQAFSGLPAAAGKPTAVIADTVRGKGLPSIERRADRWFVNFTHEEIEMLLLELRGGASSALKSDPLFVR
ncbi:MAG TPA: 1-deoxy-D-xylulose-5-phosphate synthase N-terminal domain-containing protein [Acidobacteriota bacterium]|nr:1-deoxy-D-xylulose-5-phosphate synthase N-terminal domain-containing protein [Acidobacteriota bacterium]